MPDPQYTHADLFSDMTRRYQEHDLPWDRELPPPEVVDLAAMLAPGRALDLGCGARRACILGERSSAGNHTAAGD